MNARQKKKRLKKQIDKLQSDNDLMRIIIADSPKMQELYDVYTKAKDLFEGIKENIIASWLQVGCKDRGRRMTIAQIYEEAKRQLDKGKITIGEFSEIVDREYQEPSKWIPVSERLPEEREWMGTKQFGTTISDEVYVTLETPDGERFTRHLSFQNGGLSQTDQERMRLWFKGAVPIAWMPLPAPFEQQEDKEKEE